MVFFEERDEVSETQRTNYGEMEADFDKNALDEFDKLFGDNRLENRESKQTEDLWKLSASEAEQEFDKLFGEREGFSKAFHENGEFTYKEKEEVHELTEWSYEILDAIGSFEEAKIYMEAGLIEKTINGKKRLINDDIDMEQVDEDGISNRERMERGRPPITKDGKEFELHHIGQKPDSPLAELTMEQHRGAGNDTVLHDKAKETEIDRNKFAKVRKEHWKNRVQ